MDGQLLTLSKIFTERLFRIPDYQRGYAWTQKQLKDFWNDISQLESDHNHYTGVLTLEEVPKENYSGWSDDTWIISSKSYQPFFLVDGQQRLTTAIILLQAILERTPDGLSLNYTEKKDIQKKFIFDSKDGGISRSYIFGYEKDNPSYEFLKTKVFLEKSSTSIGEETIYTQNLEFAKTFFSEKIADLAINELEVLFKKITQQLLFNIFTITEDVDVCVAFETMNNRGRPLSYLELLKNRLIYLSIKIDAPDYERAKLRSAINDCWKTIYHNLGRNKDYPLDDDRFLVNHYNIYFMRKLHEEQEVFAGSLRYRRNRFYNVDYATDLLENRFIPKNTSKSAPDELRLELKDIYDYVSSLQYTVEIWYKIFNPFYSDYPKTVQIWLDKLNRLDAELFHPLLLVFLRIEHRESTIVDFLKIVEKILFLNTIMSGPYSRRILEIEVDVFQLAFELANGTSNSEKVIKHLNEEALKSAKDTKFMSNSASYFRDYGFYNWEGIKYFLFEYNLYLESKSKTERSKIFWPEFIENHSDYYSVEHIYPQHARHQYWTSRFSGITQKQREALRNSLGNLLPLSRKKNSSLSNKPFPIKVDSDKDSIGYRYGSYAENEITKYQDWTPVNILNRGLKLLGFMEQRWGINFGDEKAKKRILGLEFLENQILES